MTASQTIVFVMLTFEIKFFWQEKEVKIMVRFNKIKYHLWVRYVTMMQYNLCHHVQGSSKCVALLTCLVRQTVWCHCSAVFFQSNY